MEKERNKKGRDKLKDKKINYFHAKFNELSHLQSRKSASYGIPFCFAWEPNQLSPTTIRGCCEFEPNLLIIQVFSGKYVIKSPLKRR